MRGLSFFGVWFKVTSGCCQGLLEGWLSAVDVPHRVRPKVFSQNTGLKPMGPMYFGQNETYGLTCHILVMV